ncbi:hypothetical protein M3D71_007565 [Micrococcus luteus]|uniref:hypothetical protein n=1 Tax=Micrococcus luteus TaxID=1270 RepID=UPI00164298AC|nr:hypothetical protein [Micrococcus luteus]MCV7512061.1 hypothetical protein [Micrococcus luteus]MCV7520682.1 hypothetical protein [Micrococcus luteus]MCV7572267.1 hypothetical protein [Micrococcus luteus]
MPEGHHAAVREDHLEARHRLPGDDAVARVAGVYLESSTRADVPLYERLGFRETGPINAYGTEDPTGMWWVA